MSAVFDPSNWRGIQSRPTRFPGLILLLIRVLVGDVVQWGVIETTQIVSSCPFWVSILMDPA